MKKEELRSKRKNRKKTENTSSFIDENTQHTERKEMDADLGKVKDTLEQRVEERTLQLMKANGALEEEIEVRKMAQEALQKSHDELERRVEERTAEPDFTSRSLIP